MDLISSILLDFIKLSWKHFADHTLQMYDKSPLFVHFTLVRKTGKLIKINVYINMPFDRAVFIK